MGFFKHRKKGGITCPNCKKPVADGSAFCDSCGLRVSPPPACAKCHLPLAPETNFCEACGTPVGTRPEGSPDSSPGEMNAPSPEKKGRSTRNRKGKRNAPRKDEFVHPSMLVPDTAVGEKTLVNPDPDPDETGPAVPDQAGVPPPAQPGKKPVPMPVPGGSRKILAAAGLVVLGIILASIFLISILHVSPQSFLKGFCPPAIPPAQSGDPDPVGTETPPAAEAPAGPSLVPGPTQVPPESLLIWLQAERDPVTNMVTVLFEGGKGQRGVREIRVRLTRSDGQVLTRTFKPLTVGEGAALPGTKYTDRLEVTVSYNNGEEYTVIDKIFEYKVRN